MSTRAPLPPPTAAERALHELVQLPDSRYEEMLAVPAEYACRALSAHSASLSRWERDRGLLRTVVNVGALSRDETRFPREEIYLASSDVAIARVLAGEPACYRLADPDIDDHGRDLLEQCDKVSALSVPLTVDDRLWGELWLARHDDGLHPTMLETASALGREVARMVAVAERLQRMARLAFEDPLTGVGNRRVLDDALGELLPPDAPGTTVVMCDIDNLKDLNDGQGHEAGDRAIKATADAFASAASHLHGAVTVRLGGDEFAVLLVGEQRSAAISLVEQAGRALAAAQPPVEISCGVAVVPPGASARDALMAADTAQYTAKARGALLVVSSDLDRGALDALGRRRVRRRVSDRPRPAAAVAEGVLDLVADLAERLGEPLGPVGARLRWIGERLLAPLNLHEWSLSHVDLAGERLLTTDSLGLRHTPVPAPHAYDLLVDHGFRLDDFPLTAQAIADGRWFGVAVDDASADEQERSVLSEMGMRYVVAVGCHDGDDGWLLELFGRDPATDVQLVGGVLATTCSALLQRPIVGLSAKMGA